jgi:hypothetical protein
MIAPFLPIVGLLGELTRLAFAGVDQRVSIQIGMPGDTRINAEATQLLHGIEAVGEHR